MGACERQQADVHADGNQCYDSRKFHCNIFYRSEIFLQSYPVCRTEHVYVRRPFIVAALIGDGDARPCIERVLTAGEVTETADAEIVLEVIDKLEAGNG